MKAIFLFYFVVCAIYCQRGASIHIDGLPYKSLITFGDSLTDSGTAYRLSNRTWPPVPPFNRNGGFSDDLSWNQIFVQRLLKNATLRDYACGGATTDNDLMQGYMSRAPNLVDNYAIRSKTKSIGVRQQVLGYIYSARSQSIDFDGTLYAIWTGTNNYPANRSLSVATTIQSIIQCASLLIEFGARNLILINEPPFDRFPQYQGKNDTNATQQLFINHNVLLAAKIKEKYPASNTSLNIRLFDSHSFVLKVMENYSSSYGFENLASCWDSISGSKIRVLCPDITRQMFCDEYHFSSKMQTLIAEELYRFLSFESSVASHTAFAPTSVSLLIFFTLVLANLFLTN